MLETGLFMEVCCKLEAGQSLMLKDELLLEVAGLSAWFGGERIVSKYQNS